MLYDNVDPNIKAWTSNRVIANHPMGWKYSQARCDHALPLVTTAGATLYCRRKADQQYLQVIPGSSTQYSHPSKHSTDFELEPAGGYFAGHRHCGFLRTQAADRAPGDTNSLGLAKTASSKVYCIDDKTNERQGSPDCDAVVGEERHTGEHTTRPAESIDGCQHLLLDTKKREVFLMRITAP